MPVPSPYTYPAALTSQPGTRVSAGNLVMNVTDANGTTFVLSTFDGWGSPGSTLQATQRARGDGATVSEPFLKPRVMTLAGSITTMTLGALDDAVDVLISTFTLAPFQLSVNEQGRVRSVSAQRQDDVIVKWLNAYEAEYSVQVIAKDPLKYGDLVTSTTLLPSSSGGLTYPITYPITYTGVTNSGVIRVTNTGNAQAPVWLRIDGPIPAGGWTITNVGKKQSLMFSVSLALGSGEFITVDMSRREVLAQGQSARSGYVTSCGWFTLDPGDNDIAFSAANYSSTAQLTVTTKPAWA